MNEYDANNDMVNMYSSSSNSSLFLYNVKNTHFVKIKLGFCFSCANNEIFFLVSNLWIFD